MTKCVFLFCLQSMYHERQGVAVVPPTVPGAYLGIPEKGTMRKQKSIGMMLVSVCVCVCVSLYCVCCVYFCIREANYR